MWVSLVRSGPLLPMCFLLGCTSSSPEPSGGNPHGAGSGGAAMAGAPSGGGSGQSGSSGGGGSATAGMGGVSGTGASGGAIDPGPACKALPFEPGIDPTFVPNAPNISHLGSAHAMDPQGRVVLAGLFGGYPGVIRFLENGAFDSGFGGEGTAVARGTEFLDQYDYPSAPDWVVVDSTGRISVIGEADLGPVSPAHISRYTDTGAPDTALDPAGMAPGVVFLRARYNPDSPVQPVTIVPDGSGAWFSYASADGAIIDRIRDDGSYDPDITPIADSGTLIAWGNETLYSARWPDQSLPGEILAFNADGTLRTDFGTDGVTSLSFAPGTFAATHLVSQPGGALVAANYQVAVRLTARGEPDASFGTAGVGPITACSIKTAALACEGRIVLGGVVGTTEYCAVVLTRDGVPIPETPSDGMFRWPAPAPISTIIEAAVEPVRGRIVYYPQGSTLEMVRIALPGSG